MPMGARLEPRGGISGLGRAFLVERLRDPGAQRRRCGLKADAATQSTAHFLKILKQFAAFAATLDMPLNLSGGNRIDLAVEICLHPKRFSALHAALLPLRAAILP